jgi:hypothetical protein
MQELYHAVFSPAVYDALQKDGLQIKGNLENFLYQNTEMPLEKWMERCA